MRVRLRWIGLCAYAGLAVAPACGSSRNVESRPVGNGHLDSGFYIISEPTEERDGCGVVSSLEGRIVQVTVTGTVGTITLDGASGSYDEGVFEIEVVETIDFNQNPFGGGALDCIVERTQAHQGITVADREAEVEWTYRFGEGTGTQCDAAETQHGFDFPCTTVSVFQLTEWLQPPPLEGTLSLLATGGQLTTTTAETLAPDSGFTLTGMIEEVGPFSVPSEPWLCFAPDPPAGFPNYDLIIGGSRDYFIVLSLTTAQWAAGTVPLVTMSYAELWGPSEIAFFEGGTVEILGAPVVVDSSLRCAVRIVDAPF